MLERRPPGECDSRDLRHEKPGQATGLLSGESLSAAGDQ
jgi:hypothetical protein